MDSEYSEFIGFDAPIPGIAIFDGLKDMLKASRPLNDCEMVIRPALNGVVEVAF